MSVCMNVCVCVSVNWCLQDSGSVNSSGGLQAWGENVIGWYQIIALSTHTFLFIFSLTSSGLCALTDAGRLVEEKTVVDRCPELTFYIRKPYNVKVRKCSTVLAQLGKIVNTSITSLEMDKSGEVWTLGVFLSPFLCLSVVAESPVHKALWLRRWRKETMVSWKYVLCWLILLTTFFISGTAESFPSAMKTKHRLFWPT